MLNISINPLGDSVCDGFPCVNTFGGYKCQCPEGEKEQCAPVDPCGAQNGGCSHYCSAMDQKTVICSCPEGLKLDVDAKGCISMDLCENADCGHKCVEFNGKAECSCEKGFHLATDRKTCLEIDECHKNNGGCSHFCTNTIGSFFCSCPELMELASNGITCIDKDECVLNNGGCSNICINLIGSFHCACEAGYKLGEFP